MSTITYLIVARRERHAREWARRKRLAPQAWRYAADDRGLRGWRGPGLTIVSLNGRHLDAEMRDSVEILCALGATLQVPA